MSAETPFWRRQENAVALLCTAAFFAAWAAVAHSSLAPRAAPQAAPPVVRLRYMPDAAPGPGASVWDHDPRALWSPVLFALPSAVGFSPARAQRNPRSDILQGEAASSGLLLAHTPPRESAVALLHGRTPGEVSVLHGRRWSRISTPADPFGVVAPGGPALHVEWPDGEPVVVAGLPLPPDAAFPADERAWELSALLYFNPEGDVRSVFIVQSTAAREVGEAALRALRRIRIAPGAPLQARINLYMQPPAAGAARAAGGTP